MYNHSKDRDALELPRTVVLDDLDVDVRIGSKSSGGHVYLAKYRPTGDSVALKVFPYDENEVRLFIRIAILVIYTSRKCCASYIEPILTSNRPPGLCIQDQYCELSWQSGVFRPRHAVPYLFWCWRA